MRSGKSAAGERYTDLIKAKLGVGAVSLIAFTLLAIALGRIQV